MTWNIEWFPKNGQNTINYVAEIIEDIDIDVITIQELDDRDLFDQMISSLDGYAGYYDSSWFAGLAFIYNMRQFRLMIFMRYTLHRHIGMLFLDLQWLWI